MLFPLDKSALGRLVLYALLAVYLNLMRLCRKVFLSTYLLYKCFHMQFVCYSNESINQSNIMNILDLPEEVIIMIIRLLDIESQHNVYNTNMHFKNIVRMYGVINSCQFSLNIMATANSLKLDFFKDISGHLKELNLCAVHDLNKTVLLPAIKKLKKLTSLDVSYTNINITDLLDLHKVCPTIKDISINFSFDKSGQVKIPLQILEQCQNMFEHFERVHFVGALINLFFSKIPLSVLQKAKLSELCITITDCALAIYNSDINLNQMVQFKLLKIFLLNWRKKNQYYGCLNSSVILSMVDLSKCEFIIVIWCDLTTRKVITSSRFKDFFQVHFGVEAEVITEWTYQELQGNVAVMIWDTESTVFDNNFFVCLSNQLKQYFPYYVSSACSDAQLPANSDWLYSKPSQHDFDRLVRKIEPDVKRRRLAPQDVLLNYDSVCKDKQKIKISLIFESPFFKCPVALSNSSDYLKKITYLSLSGHAVYSPDFFKILFCCCNNLVTINSATTQNATQALSRNIPSSTCIKNLRLVVTTIDFKSLFQSLSQCRYLENVHLINENSGPNDLTEPKEMFQRCIRLYNLSICMPMTDNLRTKKLQMLNRVKAKFARDHLNIELHIYSDVGRYGYDPFIDVFNLNPIKVV